MKPMLIIGVSLWCEHRKTFAALRTTIVSPDSASPNPAYYQNQHPNHNQHKAHCRDPRRMVDMRYDEYSDTDERSDQHNHSKNRPLSIAVVVLFSSHDKSTRRTIIVRRFGNLAQENQNGENRSRLHEIVRRFRQGKKFKASGAHDRAFSVDTVATALERPYAPCYSSHSC